MVMKAVFAPLRSIRALVASVVPWMKTPMSCGFRPGLGQHDAYSLDDAQFRRMGGGEDLAAPALRAVFEHNVGEGAANVGGEFCLLSHTCG